MSNTKKVPVTREKNKCWIGCDISKATFEIALWPNEPGKKVALKSIPTVSFERSVAGVDEFYNWLKPKANCTYHIVMEATGIYSKEAAKWLLEKDPELLVSIINPNLSKAFNVSLGVRNKTDAVDSRCLALFGVERNPELYHLLSKNDEDLRVMVRSREFAVEMRKQIKTHLMDMDADSTSAETLGKIVDALDEGVEFFTNTITAAVKSDAKKSDDYEMLTSISGVGIVTATTVIAELGDLRDYKSEEQLASYVGLSVKIFDSGSSVHKKPRITKQGNRSVRKVLYMAAMSTIQKDNDFADLYNRLVAKGKAKKVAICAVMRRMLLTMRAILKNGKEYDANYLRNKKAA